MRTAINIAFTFNSEIYESPWEYEILRSWSSSLRESDSCLKLLLDNWQANNIGMTRNELVWNGWDADQTMLLCARIDWRNYWLMRWETESTQPRAVHTNQATSDQSRLGVERVRHDDKQLKGSLINGYLDCTRWITFAFPNIKLIAFWDYFVTFHRFGPKYPILTAAALSVQH